MTRFALDTLQHELLDLVELCVHVALTNVKHQFEAHHQVTMLTSRTHSVFKCSLCIIYIIYYVYIIVVALLHCGVRWLDWSTVNWQSFNCLVVTFISRDNKSLWCNQLCEGVCYTDIIISTRDHIIISKWCDCQQIIIRLENRVMGRMQTVKKIRGGWRWCRDW